MKEKQWGETLYITALIAWLLVGLIKYTYFKDMLPMKLISDPVMYGVLSCCLVKTILEADRTPRNLLMLGVTLLFIWIAFRIDKLPFAVMFALIYGGRNVSFRKLCRIMFWVQLLLFLITVLAAKAGVLEDVLWEEGVRNRHGLGFTHCMLASHFGLFTAIAWISEKNRLREFAALVILISNGILYCLTNGRSDFLLSILLVVSCLVCERFFAKKKFPQWFAYALMFVPWICLIASIGVTMAYQKGNPVWEKWNYISNNRLKLGYEAIVQYGFTWFGQKIRFIGASTLYYKPDAVYNYVDNAYLMQMLLYGTVFILVYCVLMSLLLYRLVMQNEKMLLMCVLISMVFGMANPQSMYLTYNPLLLLLVRENGTLGGIEVKGMRNKLSNGKKEEKVYESVSL